MTKREGVPACGPIEGSWWCRLKERIDYLWDRASACIVSINHQTPDGDGDFAITGGDGITVTGEDNGIRIEATLTEETVEGIVGQEAAARQQADQALQADIDTKADAADLTAETQARQQADAALQSGKLDKNQGTGNAGKVLVVGGDGTVAPGTSSASVAWGGISGELADQTDLSDALDAKANASSVSALTTRVSNLETGTVKTKGNQTIDGLKTFAQSLYINSPAERGTLVYRTGDAIGGAWRRFRWDRTYGYDAEGTAQMLNAYMVTNDSNITSTTITSRNINDDGTAVESNIIIRAYNDGRTQAIAPATPINATETEIVTANSLNRWSSIVRTVGNQQIAGVKTFTQTPQAPTPAASAAGMEIVTAAWVRAHDHPRTYTAARLQQILASGGSLMGHLTVESASADYSGMISAVLDSGGVSYTGGILSDGSSVLVCLSIKIVTGISTASLMTLNGNRQSGSIESLFGWVFDTTGKVVDP